MGIFKKLGDQMSQAAQGMTAPTDPAAVSAQQRAMGIDTANFGGPSNAPVADDDPIFDPIEGISLQTYAVVAKKASNLGVTDEAGMAEVAAQEGLDPTAFAAAVKGWVDRMGQNMAVGQKFRQYYDPA